MSKAQDDLRDRLESMVSSWCKEWDGCAYDVVGVLTVYCHSLSIKLNEEDEDENQE